MVKECLKGAEDGENVDWKRRFEICFGDECQENIKRLKKNRCFSKMDWKQNMIHIIDLDINEDEVYNQVLENILFLHEIKSKKFVLSDLYLRNVPTAIGNLKTHLENLYLHELDIKKLPKEMSNCKKLKQITIIKCPINNVPDWFSQFKNLVKLDLSRCEISKISEELSQCQMLNDLRLDCNKITEIPESVLRLPKIQMLDVSSNPLTLELKKGYIPSCFWLNISYIDKISGINNLNSSIMTTFIASFVELSCIPKFEKIKNLDLSGSKVKKIEEQEFIKILENGVNVNISGLRLKRNDSLTEKIFEISKNKKNGKIII